MNTYELMKHLQLEGTDNKYKFKQTTIHIQYYQFAYLGTYPKYLYIVFVSTIADHFKIKNSYIL